MAGLGPLGRLDVRSRLFLVSLGLLVFFGGISGVLLEHRIRARTETSLRDELQTQARLLAISLDAPNTSRDPDALADAAGALGRTRFSIITADGTVIGDSLVDRAALPGLDDHSQRPEVLAARAQGLGVAQRFSHTLEQDMLYVAVPRSDGSGDVVRAAMSMADLGETIWQLRLMLLAAGFLGLVVAGAMSGLASHWVSRDLRELLQQAQSLAQGAGRRLSLSSPRGELSSLVGSFNRLSEELEQALASLAVERDRFGAVLEGMGEAVVAVDEERRITLLNPAAFRLFRPSRPPLGQPLLALVRASSVHDAVGRALSGEADVVEFVLSADAPRHILSTITPQQRGRGCVLVCRDVTELRRLERMRRDFVANVSHELRTPVTIIRANAETLMDGALDDPQHAPIFVAGIHRNAERLTRLIEGLLNLSHLETGSVQLDTEPLLVAPLVEQVYLGLRTKAEARQQVLRQTVPPELAVTADAQSLEQILTNLVDNALKYCPEQATILVRARIVDDGVRIEVVDDGPGISEHHQGRLFERFYRVDAGRSKQTGGTGLGLAIVKHLAELMGGRVGVFSEPPEGTTFWVELPVGEVAPFGED